MSLAFDVFFYEAFEEEERELIAHLPPSYQAGFTWKTIQEHSDCNDPPAPIISVRTQSHLPTIWAKHLRGVLTRSTGYDHLLGYYQSCRGDISLGYLPLYCNRAVAEQAMLLWTALLRKLTQQIHNFATFHRDGLTGRELKGKVIVVVGVGNIGSEVVKIARGLEMKPLGVDLVRKYDFVDYTNIKEALPIADVVVCCMNLTPINKGYFSYECLRTCKQSCMFVNTARGELAPPEGLLKLLEEGHLGGVGIDVYDQEKALATALRQGKVPADPSAAASLALSQRPDVICTPHNAFNTEESVSRKAAQSVESILEFAKSGKFVSPVPTE